MKVPPAGAQKKRRRLEPITYDELLGNAGMSGFVSFLEPSQAGAGATPDALPAQAPSAKLKTSRRGRTFKARDPEDGHSLAEQAVYTALWSAAVPLNLAGSADRSVRIGYHRLAQLTRLSWISVKNNLRSLEKKLAIEVTALENSNLQQGKSYVVYSRHAILERRKRAGLEWVRKTRGVELLTHEGQPGLEVVKPARTAAAPKAAGGA
jgi:hypothetical protein